MNKKNKNKFDSLVESLVQSFSNIENFELLSESEETRKISKFLVQTILDLNSIKTLFVNIYVPQTNKFIYDWKHEFQESKYAKFLTIDENLWKHETNELVRIGYVTLFHKYENFVGSIFPLLDGNYIKSDNKSINLKQYALKKFEQKIDKEWYLNKFLKKLNWICNSQKHNDGFPQVNHPYYKEESINKILYPESDKIKISAEMLKKDIEFMVEFVQIIFRHTMLIALFKMAEESLSSLEIINDDLNRQQQLDLLTNGVDKMGKMMKMIKGFDM